VCKIIVLTNASKIPSMPAFTRLMSDLLSDLKDGFGAVMFGEKGAYGVKTLSPGHLSKPVTKKMSFVKNTDMYFGNASKTYGPALFHGRVSTNSISIINTHPMIKENHYMIHNGVVENEGEDYQKETTNDSEDILHHFITGGIEKVSKNISGYYACAIINPDGTMSLFRDNIANLFCAWSDKLESYIFATTESLLDKIGSHIKEELAASPVKDCIYLRFKGNDIIEETAFENLGYASTHAKACAVKSLGREWDAAESYGDIPSALDYVADEYFDELDRMDERYVVTDEYGHEIGVDEFLALPIDCKILCTVKRPNGIVVDPFERVARTG